MTTTRHRIAMWAALLMLPVACAVLYTNDPADGGIYPPCPFRTITGFDCPGCGTGRALHAMLHGRLGVAVDLNVMTVLFLPVALYTGVSYVSKVLWDRPLPVPKLPPWTGWAVTATVLTFFVVRNLPFGPLQWMASYR